MNLLDLFEQQQHPAYRNLNALQQAVKASQDAVLDFGGEATTVDYPVARYILSRYQAQQTGTDRGQFLAALADARKFDAIAGEYRQLADKARLEEQYSGSPKAIGTAFLGLILKHQKDSMPVLIDFEDGQQAFRLTTPEVKDWFTRVFDSYRRRGKEDQFLELMGTRIGFQKLVSRFITDKAKLERERLGITSQKKRSDDLTEKDDGVSARTRRMLDQFRMQHPYAANDMEALAYSFVDAQKKDREDIDKLEKEIDDAEKSVKSDLKSALGKIKGRGEKAREKLGGISATDERQDELLKKIVALDKQQSQAIDDLEREIGSATKSVTAPTAAAAPVEPEKKSKQPAAAQTDKTLTPSRFGAMAQQLTQPTQMKARKQSMSAAAVKARAKRAAAKTMGTTPDGIETLPGTITSPDMARQIGKDIAGRLAADPEAAADVLAPNVSDIQAARDRRDAQRAARAQPDLFKQPPTRNQQQVANLEEQDIVKPQLTRIHYFRVNPSDADLAEKAGLRKDRGGNWVLLQYDKSGSIFNQKMTQAIRMFGRPTHTQSVMEDSVKESLRPGEWHNAEVTFDDGSKETVRITSDEGFSDQITQHFAKKGRKVKSIDVDWSVRSQFDEAKKKPTPTNPELWSRAKSAARSKFDVYPSAYANAWAAKWYKARGGGWRMGKGAKK